MGQPAVHFEMMGTDASKLWFVILCAEVRGTP